MREYHNAGLNTLFDRRGAGVTQPSVDLSKTSGTSPPFEITVFTSDKPLSKTIKLDDNDGLVKSASHPIAHGYASRLRITGGMQQLADTLDHLTKNQAIATGRLCDDLPDKVEIATKKFLSKYPGAVGRLKANIVHVSGEPGSLLLDFDTKGMTPEVKNRLAALGGFAQAISYIVPAVENCARLLRPSTSANIRNIKTGKMYPGGGEHLYLMIKDIADSERALKALHDWCWYFDLGWSMVSTAGSVLERSIVDVSTWGSERLCYEAVPVLGRGLVQEKRTSTAYEGQPLDTINDIPDPSPQAMEKINAKRQAERERLNDKCAAVYVLHCWLRRKCLSNCVQFRPPFRVQFRPLREQDLA